MRDPDLDETAARRVLRGAFLSFFAGQAVVAVLVAAVIALVAGARPRPTPWVGAVVVAASLGQLLLGLAVSAAGGRTARLTARRLEEERLALAQAGADGEARSGHRLAEARRAFAARLRAARGAALWATVMAAVLLSMPAWFAAFAWLGGNRGPALLGASALLALGYAFGFAQLGGLARGVRVRDAAAVPADGAHDPGRP